LNAIAPYMATHNLVFKGAPGYPLDIRGKSL